MKMCIFLHLYIFSYFLFCGCPGDHKAGGFGTPVAEQEQMENHLPIKSLVGMAGGGLAGCE